MTPIHFNVLFCGLKITENPNCKPLKTPTENPNKNITFMKKTFFAKCLLFALALPMMSCGGGEDEDATPPKDDPTPSKPVASITITGEAASGLNFPAEGGSKTITFTATADWSVAMASTGSGPWCSVSPSSGNPSQTSVSVTVEPNTGYDDRSVSVNFTCGTQRKTVVVTQKQKDALLVTSDKVEMDNKGGTFTSEVKANISYTVNIPDQFAGWISSATSRALKTSTETFNVAANEDFESREGYVVFSGGGIEERVNVYQAGGARLLLSAAETSIDARGGSVKAELQSNCDFTVEMPEAQWIRKDESRAMSSHTVYFTVDENAGTDDREAQIRFVSADKSVSETLKVVQRAKGAVVLTDRDIEVSAGGGVYRVEYTSNIQVAYDILDGADSWISKTDESRAMTKADIWFNVKTNLTDSPRTGRVILYAEDSRDIADTLTFRQEAPAVAVTDKEIEVPAAGGVYKVEYESNLPVIFDYIDDAGSWISKTDGSRAMTKTEVWFDIKTNLTENPRTGKIVFHPADSRDIADTLTFRQEAPVFEIISMTPESATFKDAAAHDIAVELKTNLEYRVDMPKYVTLVSDPEDKEHPVFRVAINDNAKASRSGSISFSTGSRMLATIAVGQEAPEVTMTDESYQVDHKGGALPLKITTNINISVKVETEGADWVKVKAASGDALVDTVEIAENTTEEERSCTLTLSAGAFWSKSVVVRQSKTPSDSAGITIPEGGNITDLLSKEEAMQIVSLKVGGEVTASDINFILRMASEGKLTELDLENATIKASSEYYDDPYYNIPGLSGLFTFKISKDNMIGEHMFAKTKFTSIKLPANTVEIGKEAFMYSEIAEIVVPDQVKVMGKGTFYGCGNLKKATLPGSLEEVPQDCFYGAKNLEYVTLGEGTKVIGKSAFGSQNNSSLREVTIPSTLTTIQDEAFMYSGIETLTLPESVVNYGASLFYQCKRLKKVVMKGVPADGVLPDKTFSGCTALAELELPEGLKVIGSNALYTIVTPTLTLPSTLKELRDGALYGCEATSLVIPEGVETLGEMSLGQMWKLTELTLPSTVRTIGDKLLTSSFLPLRKLHCRMTVPPVPAGALVKDGFDFGGCTLYVPSGSADAYKAAQYWSSFTKIQEE